MKWSDRVFSDFMMRRCIGFCLTALVSGLLCNSAVLDLSLAGDSYSPSVEAFEKVASHFTQQPNEEMGFVQGRDELFFTPVCDSLDEKPETLAERLENLGQLYSSDTNPVLQEWWFLGRYHGQYYNADGDGAQQDDWENRRFRIGSQARLFDKLTLHAQMVSGFDIDPFYNGFTELWTQWAFAEAFAVTLGQQKHRFTHDRNVSSRYINTLERSMLTNMFNADYTPAVTASGSSDKFAYYTGIFSNATSADIWEAFTDYDSGYSLLASGTWDINRLIRLDEAFLNVCYLYSDANQNATNLNRYKDGVSAALILTEGAGSLVSEVLLGTRSANGDAFGINIQPGFFVTEKLQLAARYQLAVADEDNGLLAQRRYEQTVGVTTGDLYQAAYAGFNYYIAGHRIKVMNGIECADMNGHSVWTASLAVRVFWGPHSNGPFPMAKTLQPN
jgi:phosphate-selective porin OprO/OprP